MTKQTIEEKNAKKREWYRKNIDRVKLISKKSRIKHKEKRALENKIWVENNKDYYKAYQKEYQKQWYQKNKEKKNLQNNQWRKNNPDKSKIIRDRFLENNPESTKQSLIKYQQTLKGMFRTMKGSGLKRNYSVDITFDDFCKIIDNVCTYCGESEKRIGIDRIDNTKGYTLENSTPCCTICNMMKKTMKVDDFISHINKIYNRTIINLIQK